LRQEGENERNEGGEEVKMSGFQFWDKICLMLVSVGSNQHDRLRCTNCLGFAA